MTPRQPHSRIARLLALATTLAAATLSHAQTPAMKLWTSKHYEIHSDLDPDLTRDLGTRLEKMYGEYSRRLANFNAPPDQKFAVHLFKRRADYMAFTNNRMPSSAGMFIPARKMLAAFEEGHGRDGLRRTLQHEAFHQFAWDVMSPNIPIWLNEGLAQVFEEGIWTGDAFDIGQVPPRRVQQLQDDLTHSRLFDFASFMDLDDKKWAAMMQNKGIGAIQYNQAWAMTHFLIYATDDDGSPRYRTRLISYLRDLHGGADPKTAFVNNFGSNIGGFQSRFAEWSKQLTPSPMSAYMERVSTLADLVRLFNDNGQKFNSVDALRKELSRGKYQITYSRGNMTWTSEKDPLIYLSDLSGKPLGRDQLYFQPVGNALPDIICRPNDNAQVRVRFYKVDSRLEHEVVVETR